MGLGEVLGTIGIWHGEWLMGAKLEGSNWVASKHQSQTVFGLEVVAVFWPLTGPG